MLHLLLFVSVQLVSESFPVSSSGHLALAVCLFFSKNVRLFPSLSAILHGAELMLWMTIPTIVVVAVFFVKEWGFLLIHIHRTWRIVGKLIGYMLCANSVTAIFYLFMRYYDSTIPLWIGFSVTAGLLFSLYRCPDEQHVPLTSRRAVLLGIVQGIALLPGISRFAAVFVTSRWMGIDARRSFRITWMLQWPLAVGMVLLSGYQYRSCPTHWVPVDLRTFLIIGGASAMALLGLYAMYLLVQRRMLWIMALYMILPIAVSFWYCR